MPSKVYIDGHYVNTFNEIDADDLDFWDEIDSFVAGLNAKNYNDPGYPISDENLWEYFEIVEDDND